MSPLLAWVLAPAVLYALLLGTGLLADRLLRTELPAPLLPPLGLGLAIVLVLPLYRLHLSAAAATPVLVVVALAGFALARGDLRERIRPGAAGFAALATYALYMAPIVLSGHATWGGYNFVNDTASNMIFADLLLHHGASPPTVDSTTTAIEAYPVAAGYPLGAHALLATLRPLTGTGLAAIYQPFLSALAALAAMSLTELARRAGLRAISAVAAAVLALGGVLLYRYTLHGAIKEIALVALLAAATALAVVALERRLELRTVALAALCGLAVVLVFSAAGAAYGLALGLAALAAAAVSPQRPSRAQLIRIVAVAGAAALVVVLPSLGATLDFARLAKHVFANSGGVSTGYLGQLVRPLPVTEAAGTWLTDDYRFGVGDGRALLNGVLIAVTLALALGGLVLTLRRRTFGPALLLATMALPAAALASYLSPYADAKLLLVLTPAVVLLAAIGALALAERPGRAARAAGIALALVLAGGVLGSDVFGYRATRLAPLDRVRAMEDAAVHARAQGGGLWLVNEWEEFAKFFMRGVRVNAASESASPRPVQLRRPAAIFGHWFDLDQQRLSYVQRFPGIIMRRSPAASRPPANFRMVYSNRYYEVWRRQPGPAVADHLPLQALDRATAVPDCGKVRALARRTRRGQRLVAAWRPRVAQLSPFLARRPSLWYPNPGARGTVVPVGPGSMRGVLATPPGPTRVWLRISGGRQVTVLVDGRRVGTVGQINTPSQWLDAGVVDLRAGRHRVEVRRSGADLAPGDSFRGELGPLALQPLTPPRLVSVPAGAAARRLCGRPWDWIERVSG